MPKPANRSNSVRKIKYRTQQGDARVRYRRRKKGKRHSCALTGQKLTGVSSQMSIAKTKRRPQRPFGGRLSPKAARKVIKYRAKLAQKELTLDDIPVELLPYMKNEEAQ